MSLPGGTHQKELRVDLTPGMTAYDLTEAARRAWGALFSGLLFICQLLNSKIPARANPCQGLIHIPSADLELPLRDLLCWG